MNYLSNDTCHMLYTAMRKTTAHMLTLAKRMAFNAADKINYYTKGCFLKSLMLKRHLNRVPCQHFKYRFLHSLVSYKYFVIVLSRMGLLPGHFKLLCTGLGQASVNWLQRTLIYEI
jgi:hypothetical protein